MFLIKRIKPGEILTNCRVTYDTIGRSLRLRGTSSSTPYTYNLREVTLWGDEDSNTVIMVEDYTTKRNYHIHIEGVSATKVITVGAHRPPRYESEELVDLFKHLINPTGEVPYDIRFSTFRRFTNPTCLLDETQQTLFSILHNNDVTYLSVDLINKECLIRKTSGERTKTIKIDRGFIANLELTAGVRYDIA